MPKEKISLSSGWGIAPIITACAVLVTAIAGLFAAFNHNSEKADTRGPATVVAGRAQGATLGLEQTSSHAKNSVREVHASTAHSKNGSSAANQESHGNNSPNQISNGNDSPNISNVKGDVTFTHK